MASHKRIVEMVMKLRAHDGNGRTKEEQAAFAGKVRDLMDRYRITESEISGVSPTDERRLVGATTWIGSGGWSRSDIASFLPQLAMVVASAHACRIIGVQHRAKFHFVGREADRAVAVFMFDWLAHSANGLCIAALKADKEANPSGDRSNFRQSFLHGFVCCISERYDERRKQTVGELAAERNEHALIRLSDELTVVDKWLERGGIKIDGMERAQSTANDVDAAVLGVEAALEQSLETNGLGPAGMTPGMIEGK